MAITGPLAAFSAAANAAGRIRPASSVAIVVTRFAPSPRYFSPENTVACASAPISTLIGGAPNMPSASTSQPTRRNTSLRAAARHTKLATVAPVTNPTDASAGSPRSSRQPPATPPPSPPPPPARPPPPPPPPSPPAWPLFGWRGGCLSYLLGLPAEASVG